MRKIFNDSGVLIAILLIFACTACSGSSKGVNLARSKDQTLESCQALAKKKKHENAIKCFEAYKSRHGSSSEAAEADIAIADAYFAKKDYIVAAQAYKDFITTYPGNSQIPYAYYRSGLCALKQAPSTIDRDQTILENADKSLGAVTGFYSNSPYAADALKYQTIVRKRLAKKQFYIGRFYYRQREYLAAIPRFQTVIKDYPGLGFDDESFYRLIVSLKKTRQDDLAKRYFEIYKDHNQDKMSMIKKMAALFK